MAYGLKTHNFLAIVMANNKTGQHKKKVHHQIAIAKKEKMGQRVQPFDVEQDNNQSRHTTQRFKPSEEFFCRGHLCFVI